MSSQANPLDWVAYAEDDYEVARLLLRRRRPMTQAGVFVAVPEDKLSLLSSYAARVRYPGDEPILEEAQDALTTAAAVWRFVRKLLGVPPRQASAG